MLRVRLRSLLLHQRRVRLDGLAEGVEGGGVLIDEGFGAGEFDEDGGLFGAVDEAEESIASFGLFSTEAFEVAIEGDKGRVTIEERFLRKFSDFVGGVGCLTHLRAPAVHVCFKTTGRTWHEGDVALTLLIGTEA